MSHQCCVVSSVVAYSLGGGRGVGRGMDSCKLEMLNQPLSFCLAKPRKNSLWEGVKLAEAVFHPSADG